MAPDGQTVVFATADDFKRSLYRRRLAAQTVELITGTADGEVPFFSPDGRSLGFFANNRLYRVPIEGGTAVAIATSTYRYGATWLPDDSVVFASNDTPDLMRVPAGGGTPEAVVPTGPRELVAGGRFRRTYPSLSPDDRFVRHVNRGPRVGP